jgi:hypothetical protein
MATPRSDTGYWSVGTKGIWRDHIIKDLFQNEQISDLTAEDLKESLLVRFEHRVEHF